MSPTLIFIGFILLLLPGFAGIFLPIPGLLYMFVVALINGLIDKFERLQPWELGILGGIALVGIFNDYLTGMLGAKYGGAAQKSMIYGIIGMVIGTFLLPPLGGLVGVFLGILIAEIFNHRNGQRAVRAATGGLLGSIAGMVITLILAIMFVFLFAVFVLNK